MALTWLAALRILHVLAAAVFFGGGLALGYGVQPRLGGEGRERYARYASITKRAGPAIGAAGGLAMVTGYLYAGQVFGWDPTGWWSSGVPYRRAIFLSGIPAVLVMTVGGLHGRSGRRLEGLLDGEWTPAKEAAAEKELRYDGALNHASFALTAVLMLIMAGAASGVFF